MLQVRKLTRKWDKATGKFTYNIAYKTRTLVTPRTVRVSEAFGLGVDKEQRHVIYKNLELQIGPRDIVLITGESGSGKSVLLRALKGDLGSLVMDIADVQVDLEKPLIDTVGSSLEEGLELLSRVGLNDAFLFLRRYSELSDGQRYRYRIAKLMESGRRWWVMDEFCATLDRETAKIVAFNVQKQARRLGCAVLAATTHEDLLQDLAPSVLVCKALGSQVRVEYWPTVKSDLCSVTRGLQLEEGTSRDYKCLAEWHYRDATRPVAPLKFFVLRRSDGEPVGIIVYTYPSVACFGRKRALGFKPTIEWMNRNLAQINRVILHPKYRSIGLGARLVRETLPLIGRPYVETVAVMARYNPFFEKAGMTRVAESSPDPRIVSAIQELKPLGFNLIFLSSENYNLQKLRSPSALKDIKEFFIEHSKTWSVLRKRLISRGEAYVTVPDFCDRVAAAGPEKIAKMLRILSFQVQTKVYLFWSASRSPPGNFSSQGL